MARHFGAVPTTARTDVGTHWCAKGEAMMIRVLPLAAVDVEELRRRR